MLLRRSAIFISLIIVWFVSLSPAIASRLSSNELPQGFLGACDDRAAPFGLYDEKITDAIDDLTAMGVFSASEFHGVKIGFCDFRRVNGPAGTTSCTDNTILLDSGYRRKNQGIVLKATLAHEMKHVFQHRELKAKFGDDYCSSDRYAADRDWMEKEADAFGDQIAALFITGRAVDIINECPVAVSVYLEADAPLTANSAALDFIEAPAYSIVRSPERAISKFFKLFAEAELYNDERKVWGDATMAHTRIINGNRYRLKSISLPNAQRSAGPFQMTLSCES